jgi:hypothetical protein
MSATGLPSDGLSNATKSGPNRVSVIRTAALPAASTRATGGLVWWEHYILSKATGSLPVALDASVDVDDTVRPLPANLQDSHRNSLMFMPTFFWPGAISPPADRLRSPWQAPGHPTPTGDIRQCPNTCSRRDRTTLGPLSYWSFAVSLMS